MAARDAPPGAQQQSSFLRVHTELAENLTMPGWEKLLMEEQQPLLHPPIKARPGFPAPADFTLARKDRHGRQLPQAIAHRGYKAKFPENTMSAFVGAVEAGAHAIETDVHLSKDGVVVLSHDPSLERCFGRKEKIIDCDWEYLETLRTLAEPHDRMPRLGDLLEFMAKPGHEHVWVLLDIKRDNDLDDVMRLIAETIAAIPPSPSRPWTQRIVLGVWAAKYLPFISQYLPHFPLTYISFSLPCAYHFLRTVPKMSFNMYAPVLAGPLGAAFRKKAHRLHRPVFVWTVNKERAMRWSIEKGLDGVVTDDPAKFLEACDRWEGGAVPAADGAEGSGERGGGGGGGSGAVKGLREEERWSWDGWRAKEVLDLLRVQVFILLMTPVVLWWLRPWGAAREVGRKRRAVEG